MKNNNNIRTTLTIDTHKYLLQAYHSTNEILVKKLSKIEEQEEEEEEVNQLAKLIIFCISIKLNRVLVNLIQVTKLRFNKQTR